MGRFREMFWQPPRAHGEAIEDRTVSFLELFYDLVYVVVIAQAAHHLAAHVSWEGLLDFAVVFSLIWIAWLNGTMYYELHGREDGRTRVFVFIQMLLLALLAVFTGEATGERGPEFALTYGAYLGVLSWLWYTVRQADAERYQALTGRYLTGMIASTVIMVASAFPNDDVRMVMWGGLVVLTIVGSFLMTRVVPTVDDAGMETTDSLVERFGLFTIIVLGEVIVGVVDGIGDAGATRPAIITGMLGLCIGFAYWWTYFDFVGRRLPVREMTSISRWILAHLPVTFSIAASGAALVSLVEHAGDNRAPEATSWMLTGTAALGVTALVIIISTLEDRTALPQAYNAIITSLPIAAILIVIAGLLRPAPWLLCLVIVLILSGTWASAVRTRLRTDPDFVS